MNFNYSSTQSGKRAQVYEFARHEIAPSVAARDHTGQWDEALFLRMGAIGLLGAPLPSDVDGHELDPLTIAAMQEGFGEGGLDPGLGLAWGVHTFLCAIPIWNLGSGAQRLMYLPKMARGEWVAALAASEPDAGSDPWSLSTCATRCGESWLLDGVKSWVVNGPIAHHYIVLAKSDPEVPTAISAFIVDRDTPGLRVVLSNPRLCMNTAQVSELHFERCELPGGSLLGRPHGALTELLPLLRRWEQGCMFMHWVGIMKALLDQCVGRARSRTQLGRQLGQFQNVRMLLAEMRIRYELARLLACRAVSQLAARSGGLSEQEMAAGRLAVAESAQSMARDAVQLHGTAGLLGAQHVERIYRDAMFLTVGSGNSGILRTLIAASLLEIKATQG